MPELPEVETIRRDLEEKILGKKIKDVLVLDKRSLSDKKGKTPVKSASLSRQSREFNGAGFKKELLENKFIEIDRRGKLLIFKIQTGKFLLVHLKMTGQLIYEAKVKDKVEKIVGGHSDGGFTSPARGGVKGGVGFVLPNKSTKVIFEFQDGSKLYFNDQRVFGYLKIVDKKELEEIKEKFGPEPLSIRKSIWISIWNIKNRKTTIKAFLLDQKNIAGIGNIYADEICFACKILPERRVNELTERDFENIVKHTKRILKLAIEKRGTTFNNYRDSEGKKGNFVKHLKVFGRQGKACVVCKNEICKIKLNGRGTHYCDKCQN